MANWKTFTKVHNFLFKVSGGRLGARLGGLDMAIMHTIGRKSGQVRPAPAACYPYKDAVVVVASNNGGEKDPVWWLNLKAQPEIEVHLGKKVYTAVARELVGQEREVFWPEIERINPRQKTYAEMTERVLPVVYLEPKTKL
jgi:deazaflavin-dependent oxidoreductase (nitroreductase family)